MLAARKDWRPSVAAWVLSIAAHLTITLLMASHTADQRQASTDKARGLFIIELERGPGNGSGQTEGSGRLLPRPETRPAAGGRTIARPDTGRPGRGGTAEADQPAANLADSSDDLLRDVFLRSRLDRSQIARIRAGAHRASPEDDQVSERPMQLTFVAVGTGQRRESRPAATTDPSGGALRSTRAVRVGRAPGPLPPELGGDLQPSPLSHGDLSTGTAQRSQPGSGVYDRSPGKDDRHSAAVMTGQPQAHLGDSSSPAAKRGPRQDTADSEQEAQSLDPGMMRASTPGGRSGSGVGGTPGPNGPGSGGTAGTGSHSSALGSGSGGPLGINPADARRRSYIRSMYARIHASWSARDFPKSAALKGRQGYTIVGFTVTADGAVYHAVVMRPSGVPSFDEKVRRAVLRAAPFGPLPPDLLPALNTSAEFTVTNPVVRPRHIPR